jgi:ABC-type polar amino acid transport system ATPase subunit
MAEAPAVRSDAPGAVLHLAMEQRFAGGFAIEARLEVSLRSGSMLVLFGPSAAGKTTILRQIAGLERPDAGAIRFDGDVWCDIAQAVWRSPQSRRVGVVFQEPTLFPHLTVRENIHYGIRVRPGSDPASGDRVRPRSDPDQAIAGIVRLLGIEGLEDRYPRALSGGEGQRVALARALAVGVILASTILYARGLVVTAALDWPLGTYLAPRLLALFLTGLLLAGLQFRRARSGEKEKPGEVTLGNPVELGRALLLAVVFAALTLGARAAQVQHWETVDSTYRQHLESVSLLVHPWRLVDSTRQTSHEVEHQWQAEIAALEV